MNIVIMAGGKGTRFWPRSTCDLPKQFIALHSERSLIQETVNRFTSTSFAREEQIYIAAPSVYLPLITEQLPHIPPSQLIIEPQQRDTAACMALTALTFLQQNKDDPLVFVPSDQWVSDSEAFRAAISTASRVAERERTIATIGAVPDRAETGFGYLETSGPAHTSEGSIPQGQFYKVSRFLEKPTERIAAELITNPSVYWNCGIWIWRPSTIAYYMARHAPGVWNTLVNGYDELGEAYKAVPSLSIDYAVMEHTESIYCVPVSCGWDDLGSWSALRRHIKADGGGNVIRGDVHTAEAYNNTIDIDQAALIIGVSDLIIVSTPNGLLICPRSEEPRLKDWLKERLN
ncbi:mannose-1-phosphate guanylyltransferase [Paenibacillus sp. GCM10023252]|uniref:mannose-1-phosphate guanylyltransferase n=1 Tax=Paenibacillus sp. GCM10023252 TaxID=3252649 RepID=UPI003609FA66